MEAVVPVPNIPVPVPHLLEPYQHTIFADLSRVSILVQGHARLSAATSRSLMRSVFKAILGGE